MTVHNQRLIERQGVLQAAWQDMLGLGLDDDEDEKFKNTWLQLRTQRLQAAGFDPVWIGKAGL
jgi:hypothetical protein